MNRNKHNLYRMLALMGMSIYGEPYTIRGENTVDTSEKGMISTYAKYLANRAKPYKGMKFFKEYGVWAINEKNAKRKSLIKTT